VEDRGQVAATSDDILNTHKPFSTRHRIVDTSGNVHYVVVVGDRLYDGRGAVIGTHGFYVDVSRLPDPEHEDRVTAKLAEIAENRAAIEQTKGMLMLIYGIDDDAAFNLLKWLSQKPTSSCGCWPSRSLKTSATPARPLPRDRSSTSYC
jgi:hypothetical protein